MTEQQTIGPAATDDRAVRAVLQGSARFPLRDDGLLAVDGADAAAFLHAQLSTDVRAMQPGDATLTAYCDARGRVLAVPRLLATADGFLLGLPRERIEPVRALLARYVLRADVRLTDVSGEHARFGIAGQSASVALAGAAGALPHEVWRSVTTGAGASIVRLQGPRPRWLVHGPDAAVGALWDALDDHVHTAAADDWRLLEIEAGIPTIHEATAGAFVAQMLNLDLLGALDFGKGCYPGQEVIARAHYLGRVKRRMYVLRTGAAGPTPRPGDDVLADGDSAGTCVDGAPHPDGGSVALTVLHVDAAPRPLRVGSPDAPAATVEEPPYSLGTAA